MMNRLTEWRGEHAAVVDHHENYIDRLAAYEDTELTPDEIQRVHATLLTVQKKHRIMWNDLQKYLQAEAEGRLLTLPCCIGTHLWKVTRPYRQAPKVTEYVVKNIRTSGKRHHIQLEVQAVNTPGTVWMEYSRFCKTREEASAMLDEIGLTPPCPRRWAHDEPKEGKAP